MSSTFGSIVEEDPVAGDVRSSSSAEEHSFLFMNKLSLM